MRIIDLQKKLWAIAVIVSLAGCNTMRGAGQDVENTGKNIKQTVDKND